MNRKDINYNKLYNYGITKSNEVELRYKDDEGDMIQLKNDQDVEEMFYDNRRKLEIFISNKMKLNANLDAMESTLQKMSIAFSIWKCPPAYIRLKIEFGRILNMKNTRIAIAKVVTMPQYLGMVTEAMKLVDEDGNIGLAAEAIFKSGCLEGMLEEFSRLGGRDGMGFVEMVQNALLGSVLKSSLLEAKDDDGLTIVLKMVTGLEDPSKVEELQDNQLAEVLMNLGMEMADIMKWNRTEKIRAIYAWNEKERNNLEMPRGKENMEDGKQEEDIHEMKARFVSDISTPDGTIAVPNERVHKIWRVENNGSMQWPIGTKLVFVSGANFGPNENYIPVEAAHPGCHVDIALPFQAPSTPDRYVSYYQMATPEGSTFGDQIWIDIMVADEQLTVNASFEESTAKYKDELACLASMGFQDTNSNITLLDNASGNLQQVLDQLLH